MEGC
jgi:hypothetical protein